jgi:uncharacterized membrane protein YkoI
MRNNNRTKNNITKITVIMVLCIIALVSTVLALNNKVNKLRVTNDKNISSAKSSTTNKTGTPSASNSGNVSDYIGIAKAETIVFAKAPKATIGKIYLEYGDGGAEYNGEAYLGNLKYNFTIDALSGAILAWKTETKSTTPKAATGVTSEEKLSTNTPEVTTKVTPEVIPKVEVSPYIGEAAAKKVALQKVPGAIITEIYLENDDGTVEYDGEMYLNNVEYKFTIDAVTGKILEWESDNIDETDDTESDD